MIRAIFLIICLMTLSSCTLINVGSQEIAEDYYPPKNSINDVVYLENVDRPHDIIGYVTVNTERIHETEEIMDRMKREAAILGGDAITDITVEAPGLWKKLKPQKLLGNAYVRANYTATVVVFK